MPQPKNVADMPVERRRLLDDVRNGVPWRKWGPYLSERQWGTVREDYSADGNAWDYFSHDQARSRAYRWGEDGIAGLSDDRQYLCFALALWNGQDPILKERMFGLTNAEGNHGEDVKEYYFYLDSTPTHSYLKMLYKYPQREFPYDDLVRINRSRSRHEMEYELLDTGVFSENRYFDVFIEYAKASPEDICIRITAFNRGPEAATLHLLPTLWFRNTWEWIGGSERPRLEAPLDPPGAILAAQHPDLGDRFLHAAPWNGVAPALLFTENETNTARLFATPNRSPYVKDAFHEYLIDGRQDAVNPAWTGTKAGAHYVLTVGPGERETTELRLTDAAPGTRDTVFGQEFDAVFRARKAEADAFYAAITPPSVGEDAANVMRQALAGMLWSKQYYEYNLDTWLAEHDGHPLLNGSRHGVRNAPWYHMVNQEVISMPDTWEYPWYAAWDLAFHTTALNMVDADFAAHQLALVLNERYIHPSGQIPAYEWNFGDVNPPVHAWATLFTYRTVGRQVAGEEGVAFVRAMFQKLLLNFTWWISRKDVDDRNVFEGGFLGMDNIGVFDRSAPLPTGGHLEQSDGTAWMALFSQNMLEIAAGLAAEDDTYRGMVLKFLEHFLWIAAALNSGGDAGGLWDEEDGFFYDVLRLPDGSAHRLKVRSLVGLLPLCATTVLPAEAVDRFPEIITRADQFLAKRPELFATMPSPAVPGPHGRRLLAVVNETRLRRLLARLLDEAEFFGPHGIRSVSRWHHENPYILNVNGQEYRVDYEPAESGTGLFGGNSNWRGPIWFPINLLILRALAQFYSYYGDTFTIECPTGSGQRMTLFEVAQELTSRLVGIFLRDPTTGRRPVYGGMEVFQNDPHWKDLILFHEYFHGDNGAGLGASHQTGWTGTVARLIQMSGYVTAQDVLEDGVASVALRYGTAGDRRRGVGRKPRAPDGPGAPTGRR